MALADKLLDNISEEQFAEYMLVEENPHIVIDEDRNIILPERYKIIAAQGDHDMATYTFDCPRFSDGRDMSEMSELLSDAINSIIDVKEESDIDSLFSAGGTSALMSDVSGLDDFELICFLVVK